MDTRCDRVSGEPLLLRLLSWGYLAFRPGEQHAVPRAQESVAQGLRILSKARTPPTGVAVKVILELEVCLAAVGGRSVVVCLLCCECETVRAQKYLLTLLLGHTVSHTYPVSYLQPAVVVPDTHICIPTSYTATHLVTVRSITLSDTAPDGYTWYRLPCSGARTQGVLLTPTWISWGPKPPPP